MTIQIPTFFRHCPRCGTPCAPAKPGNAFHCLVCDFLLYFNPAIAVATIVLNARNQVLLIRRAKDPGKGRLAFPGGFVDAGEKAEDAARREVQEELKLTVPAVTYICSQPNQYAYKGIPYTVLDLFYTGRVQETVATLDRSEVESIVWAEPAAVRIEDLAFVSHAEAWRAFVQSR
jgi:NAD+ diphosphatase